MFFSVFFVFFQANHSPKTNDKNGPGLSLVLLRRWSPVAPNPVQTMAFKMQLMIHTKLGNKETPLYVYEPENKLPQSRFAGDVGLTSMN